MDPGRKYLTAEERARFLAAVRAHRQPAVQTLETLARTLAMTGCRVSETLALRPCDVDLEAAELRIATLKRRREHWRAVPVPEDLARELELVHRVRRAQASPRGRTRALWPITCQAAHRQVGTLMAAAGISGPQACPRGLRHGYGVAVLGHASLDTTAVYTTAIGAGIALAVLIFGSTRATRRDIGERLDRMDQRLDRFEKRIETVEHNQEKLKDGLAELRERMAKLEGLLEGLREAITARHAA